MFRFTVQDDIATNTTVVDGRLSLAPVMSKKELRKGFAISAAVPFVKAGTLKARVAVSAKSNENTSKLLFTVCCLLDWSVTEFAAGRAVFPCCTWVAVRVLRRANLID